MRYIGLIGFIGFTGFVGFIAFIGVIGIHARRDRDESTHAAPSRCIFELESMIRVLLPDAEAAAASGSEGIGKEPVESTVSDSEGIGKEPVAESAAVSDSECIKDCSDSSTVHYQSFQGPSVDRHQSTDRSDLCCFGFFISASSISNRCKSADDDHEEDLQREWQDTSNEDTVSLRLHSASLQFATLAQKRKDAEQTFLQNFSSTRTGLSGALFGRLSGRLFVPGNQSFSKFTHAH